jgi:hypothetical protein
MSVAGAAVLVVLAIGLVVFLVVARPIVQREAVVSGDEIDAGPGAATLMVEHVRRRDETRCQCRDRRFAAPEITRGITELVVPFRPAGWETADLITTGADVPGFGDQLHCRQQWVLIDGFQEAALFGEAVDFARQDGAEIEAEAVDMHLPHPVAQAVRHHLDDAGIGQVDCVAGAGVVDVIARLVRHQPIIAGIVDALEGQGRAKLVAFGGVIIDDIEDDLEPAGMQR